MTHGKTYNKSPRRINHKATKSKTNTGTTSLWALGKREGEEGYFYIWGLSYECGASCLGASFMWGELSWGVCLWGELSVILSNTQIVSLSH